MGELRGGVRRNSFFRISKVRFFIVLLSSAGISFLLGFSFFYFFILPYLTNREGKIEIPDVTGKSLMQAEQILKRNKISFSVLEKRYDANVPEGFILSQDPSAKEVIGRKGKVKLVVSLGNEKVTVPSIVGLTVTQARLLLERSSLTIGERKSDYSDSIPKNCILAQRPPAGSIVERGTSISWVESLGSRIPIILMPNLLGNRIEEAKEKLGHLGLVIGEVSEFKTDTVDAGLVVLQAPQPGFGLLEGDTIKLGVSKK